MHEHRRPDRDDHIVIDWSNIKDGDAKQYWRDEWVSEGRKGTVCKLTGNDKTDYSGCVSGDLVTAFGQPYDQFSVMHYGSVSG